MNCDKTVEVIAIERRSLRVKPISQALCPACTTLGRCRADWLSFQFADQTFEIPTTEPKLFTVGESITLSVDRDALSVQIVKLYGPPLLGLLLPIGVGQSLGWSELVQAPVSVLGLVLGWWLSHRFTQTFQIRINR